MELNYMKGIWSENFISKHLSSDPLHMMIYAMLSTFKKLKIKFQLEMSKTNFIS